MATSVTKLDLSSFKKALHTYQRTCHVATDSKQMDALSKDVKEAIHAGVIQNFEFSYEICWKFMKRWLEINFGGSYVDGVSRNELFRLAAESQLITDVEAWMLYHRARNQTSHVYDEDIAKEVYQLALSFLPVAQALYQKIKSKI